MIMKVPKTMKVIHNPLPTVLLFLKAKSTNPQKEKVIEMQKIIPYFDGDGTLLRVRASMIIPTLTMLNEIQMEAHNLRTPMR